MPISSTHRRDTFCWNYTRSCQYTVKSGYWVAQNLLTKEEEKEILEPSITKLQAFAWKLKTPRKMWHLIWQLITGQVAVTRNLESRNISLASMVFIGNSYKSRYIPSGKRLHKHGLSFLEEK
ncbi:unnamed protein product [Brassica rapa]|uniref:Reverse transcriptase zinc-binding domain-containing protein n=1 Tax=Brassica campestris TaxID=3711 RepID=A0A8D9GX61_BRACM|nr:unnamed protein product [Brassica rapa]